MSGSQKKRPVDPDAEPRRSVLASAFTPSHFRGWHDARCNGAKGLAFCEWNPELQCWLPVPCMEGPLFAFSYQEEGEDRISLVSSLHLRVLNPHRKPEVVQ